MKTINKLCFALLLILVYSCDDIIEEDITDDNITVQYPLNNQQIESNVVNFQWQELKGADDYRVQVYSTNQNMMLDTLVNKTSFTYALNPGTYQWRVRGENFAYETPYTFPMSFTLITTDDLTNQQVVLLYPGAGAYTKLNSLTFSWTDVTAASHYNYQLIDVTNGNALIHEVSEITGTSYTLPTGIITQDAQYTWKVKAMNTENDTETPYASRNFYVDTTAPNIPLNTTPLNNAELPVNDAVDFGWTVASDSGPVTSSISYSIQIAQDLNFATIINTGNSNSPSYQYTFTLAGTYYWRIRATDQAGNVSSYSAPYKITIE